MKRLKREHGRIMSVETKVRGDALDADAAAGATTLVVGDAGDFDEDGGWLVINDQVVEYLEVDDDEGTITLAEGLDAAAEEGDDVHVWSTLYDEVVDYQEALVELDGEYDNPEPVVAEVAEGVGDLPEGDRGAAGESCTLLRVSDDEWEVVGVGGRARKSKGLRAEADDFYVLTAEDIAAGVATVPLSHRPDDEWLILWWRTVAQEPTEYTVNYDAQTITYPLDGFEAAGDRIWVHYAYRKGIGRPRERLSIPLGSIWKYATGLGSSTAYAAPTFDDSSWVNGATPFGWGGYEDIATVVPSPMNVWYRFTAESFGGDLLLTEENADNQMKVYIDGALVWTQSYGAGPFSKTVSLDAGVHTFAVYATDDGVSGGYSGLAVEEL